MNGIDKKYIQIGPNILHKDSYVLNYFYPNLQETLLSLIHHKYIKLVKRITKPSRTDSLNLILGIV